MFDLILALLGFTYFIGSIVGYCLLIWFKKDAIVEYTKLISHRLYKKLWMEEYEAATVDDPGSSYPKFILEHVRNNFLTRMLSCEICFSAWIAGLFNAIIYLILGWNLHWWYIFLVLPGTFSSAYAGLYRYFALIRMMTDGNTKDESGLK